MLTLQAAAGNRATSELIRSRHLDVPAVQRYNLSTAGSGYKKGGREQVELAWALTDARWGIKISFKVTASRRGSKVLESPTANVLGGDATWSLGENKAALEKASGKWGAKLSSALGRGDWSAGPIPGFPALRVRLTGKGPEGKFDLTKGQADLDLLSVALTIDGDAIELLDWAGLAHLKDRVSVKATIEAKKGLSVADAARIKSALAAKEEIAAAAKEAAKHAEDFAQQKRKLDAVKAEGKRLAKQATEQQRKVARAQRAVEAAKGADLRFSHHQTKLRRAELQLRNARAALATTEKKLMGQKAAKHATVGALKKARDGLAAAGQKLAKAGHKLDGALKNVKSKLGETAKKQIDKVTKGIMKKLGKTLLTKGLMKLIPGLNILSTIWDIGNLLWDVFGSEKSGQPGGGGGGGGGGEEGSTDQTGHGAGSGSGSIAKPGAAGGGTANDVGTPVGIGTSGGPGTKTQLNDRARQLVDAFAGRSVALDDAAVDEINRGIPGNITTAELPQLVERLKAKGGGDLSNLYELLAEIQAELADLRAGKPMIEFEGRPPEEAKDGPPVMEPPKTLFSGTRQDVKDVLIYNPKSDQLTLKPEFEKAYADIVFPHPDGLQVKLASMEVSSRRLRGEADTVIGTVIMKFIIHALPGNAPADYPYKRAETDDTINGTSSEDVKMTFLYAPKRKLWGEMDYSLAAQLRPLLSRAGTRWTLTGVGQTVTIEHASLKITKLLRASTVTGPNGAKVHKFVLEVVPVAIAGVQAGYTTEEGWVVFKRGVPAQIPFDLHE